MEEEYCLASSSVNLRLEPTLKSSVVHALHPQEPVRILSESGDMLKVETTRGKPSLVGYALRSAIIRGIPKLQVFPTVALEDEFHIPAVPISLPLMVFREWLATKDESPWLPASYANAIRLGDRPSVGASIREAIASRQGEWDAWVQEVLAQGREASCTLDEWVALIQGGREMWSIRAERIFEEASTHSGSLGWVVPDDVVHWTGHVGANPEEAKYKTWYEVEFTKLDRQIKGWFKASLLDQFFMPTPDTDLAEPENKAKVFDLSKARLRIPADPEITEARQAGRLAAQFIDVKRALGWGELHHNLCGEFCVAALAGSDVIPVLQSWLPAYPGAQDILAKDLGTSLVDLQSMLDVLGMKYEYYRAEGSVAPLTPTYLRKQLDTGRMAITFTGVLGSGVLKAHSRIRHWIVIEDILRVANSAWLRVFNPYTNREEVYRYEDVVDMPSRTSIGLWIEPRHPLYRPPVVKLTGQVTPVEIAAAVG